ncbi:trans-sulfuration enzyme family protein [Pseudahrensia aquimaris]|uniref:Trans-sulfuration enzyme family protein n=1 Tax=Pseudahrensia aquimaris TaxID=744461 RepID=A0ABW3FF29_9HYPH
MSGKNTKSLATHFAQAGGAIDPTTGAVVPPIHNATTFVRDENYEPFSPDHIYSRDQNDLYRLAESLLCEAEHAQAGLLLPSGMAAVATLVRTVPNRGRIVLQSGIYWAATKFVREFCARRQVELVEVDCADQAAFREVLEGQKADLVWIETPSNPYLKTVDVAASAKLAHAAGAVLAVDSTAATPILQQPLDLGADIVMHSATKGINGHSDVLAGFVACRDASHPIWELLKTDRAGAGAVIGSFEAWLLVRGMRTLPLRVERMSENALAVAEAMHAHSGIDSVLYPGLPSDPGHVLAKEQMSGGFGSLLSIRVKGGREAALKAVGKMQVFKRATSLGGVESLVEHRHTIENTVPDDLLRLSVGIESADDLIGDLVQALG